MGKSVDDYIAGLSGWRAETVEHLRRDILAVGLTSEAFKWGHPIYESDGPVCLIQAHKAHVTFGFWRGAEMQDLAPRLVPHGSFLMASIKLSAEDRIAAAAVRDLVERGVALNRSKGSPLAKTPAR